MSHKSDVFNKPDEIYLVFIEKKVNLLFILYFLKATCNISRTEKGGVENAKRNINLANPNNFGTKIFVTF